MGWHNHEENIRKAKEMLYFIKAGFPLKVMVERGEELYSLLQSFIEDAEIGSARIKALEEENHKLKNQLEEYKNAKS